jgi:hypothetical protein
MSGGARAQAAQQPAPYQAQLEAGLRVSPRGVGALAPPGAHPGGPSRQGSVC